jgi:hypothetical protein
MGRIRSIKPEFWTSEQIVECSPSARLLFIGLWNFCDDGGRHPASLARIKMEVFPADAITIETIRGWVDELKNARDESGTPLLTEYSVNGCGYWEVTGWASHQRVERPTYKHPAPDGKVPNSSSARRGLGEASPPESSRVESSRVDTTDRSIDRIESIDHFRDEKPIDWSAVASSANAICKKLALPPGDERDRKMILCAAALVQSGRFPEAWLADCVEAARATQSKQKKPWAYLQRCLTNKAAEYRANFPAELAAMDVPAAMLKRRKNQEAPE